METSMIRKVDICALRLRGYGRFYKLKSRRKCL